jgi:hypothetical protein
MTALDLARKHYRSGDSMVRSGVKIRVAHLIQADPTLDSDSTFIKAVADEQRGDPLP